MRTGLSFLLVVSFVAYSCSNANGQGFKLDSLGTDIEAQRVTSNLPAIGVAIVTSQGIQHLEVAGFRKRGAAEQVTKDGLWHIGSCGKAITATMMARLVQSGSLRWEQTLGETFPDLVPEMSDETRAINLVQLLSHTSGLDGNFKTSNYTKEKDLVAARLRVVQDAIRAKFDRKPGEFHYSNWGYTVAAAMAERATGKDWETLVRQEVFEPLGMTSAGFGGTGTVGQIDQPWPHFESGSPVPSNGPATDNVPTMGPAGTMHMTLADWGKFISEHIRGGRGESVYLNQEHYAKMYEPVSNDYALGWGVANRAWGGKVLTHSGDNTMNHAVVWVSPEKDFAVLVATNQSKAGGLLDPFCAKLIEAWVAEQSTRSRN
ncbi:serine hydrolase domain-containing protein [Pirellulaceae bacterium SH449]